MDFLRDPHKRLHVMGYFMRDDISLGEIARCREAVLKIPIEGEVDIEFVIAGAVKGAGGSLSETAGRADGIGEEHQFGLLVTLAPLLEKRAPGILRIGEDDRDEFGELIVLRRA